jgi:hypothetical protein
MLNDMGAGGINNIDSIVILSINDTAADVLLIAGIIIAY